MDKQIIVDYKPLEFPDLEALINGKTPDEVIQKLEDLKAKYPDRDIFFDVKYCSFDGELECALRERRLENDKELRNRLQNEARKAAQDAKALEKKEATELALYKKLKKKFDNLNTRV